MTAVLSRQLERFRPRYIPVVWISALDDFRNWLIRGARDLRVVRHYFAFLLRAGDSGETLREATFADGSSLNGATGCTFDRGRELSREAAEARAV